MCTQTGAWFERTTLAFEIEGSTAPAQTTRKGETDDRQLVSLARALAPHRPAHVVTHFDSFP